MATLPRASTPNGVSDFLNDEVQQDLARWNHVRLNPASPRNDWEMALARDYQMLRLEGHFVEELRTAVAAEARKVPTDPSGFVEWFEGLKTEGPGQGDPLFPWLAERATWTELRWYLLQEAAGEAGFDDLVAYAQVKLPQRAKLELARNYWDEMGRGNPKGMHGPMLQVLVDHFKIFATIETSVWESLALANAMTAMATSRRYAWHSIGALGVIELTAPGRSACVAQGLRRLDVPAHERRYFDLHAVLDVKHSAEWNKEVLAPLVKEDPSRATSIAEGALIRLECGRRCFERYRAHLW